MEEAAMATLNVKNLPDRLHKKLNERAAREHRSVAQEVIHLLTAAVDEPKPLSILSLKGLGKDTWRDVDPTQHVASERDSWD